MALELQQVSRSGCVSTIENGAAEWRLFETAPISVLLAESFARRVPSLQRPFGSVKQPALILNATMISHPDDESEVLKKTINPPTGPEKCDEAERTYKEMGGGRLIFLRISHFAARPPFDLHGVCADAPRQRHVTVV